MKMGDDPSDRRYELDVRDLDDDPFSEIMSTLAGLSEDETVVLINTFEPEPLYTVLEQRGFTYETDRVAPDEWRVEITRA